MKHASKPEFFRFSGRDAVADDLREARWVNLGERGNLAVVFLALDDGDQDGLVATHDTAIMSIAGMLVKGFIPVWKNTLQGYTYQ